MIVVELMFIVSVMMRFAGLIVSMFLPFEEMKDSEVSILLEVVVSLLLIQVWYSESALLLDSK